MQANRAHVGCYPWGLLQRCGEFVRWRHPLEGLPRPGVDRVGDLVGSLAPIGQTRPTMAHSSERPGPNPRHFTAKGTLLRHQEVCIGSTTATNLKERQLMSPTFRHTLALCLFALVAAACSGDDGAEASPTSRAAVTTTSSTTTSAPATTTTEPVDPTELLITAKWEMWDSQGFSP